MSDKDTILTEKLETLPSSPGVYLMKNKAGKIIYVGKAQDLKKRVSSYFREIDKRDPRTGHLVKNISDFSFIVTDTEKEALLTEGTLIKEHRPKYNIDLKDDKNYLCLRIDTLEDFPRFTLVRHMRRDHALYFGPYTNAKAIRDSLKWLSATFQLRICSDHKLKNRSRPCLYYEIGHCSAPCTGLITEEEYKKNANQAVLFLRGKDDELIHRLNEQMMHLSDDMRYEEAAVMRDRIESIRKMVEVQKVVTVDTKDRDVIGIYREGLRVGISVLFIRGGRLMGSWYQLFKNVFQEDPEATQSFLEQFYRGERYIPNEILLPFEIPDHAIIEEWFSAQRRVTCKAPKRGLFKGLVSMAIKNAETSFMEWKKSEESRIEATTALTHRLGLSSPPQRMECFDISTIHGAHAVGSMAVFTCGEPDKKEYRHFRIRGVKGIDDYAMMEELLSRRIQRLGTENRPDLIVIDGGKGHLAIALAVLKNLGHADIPLISIAKERSDKKELDRIYLPGRKNPITAKGTASPLFLLLQLRDEAHRFAVSYHRKLRKKRGFASLLDEIPGIGQKRKRALLKHFPRIADLKGASVEELSLVPGITPTLARSIKDYILESEKISRTTES
jgi:excinuclease ABC subunit C